jgi:hypothetical protein
VSSFRIVPFDEGRHGPFVYDTFRKTLAEQWPWSLCSSQALLAGIKGAIASPGVTTLVAEVPDAEDAFAGWACVVPGGLDARPEVIFAYTRHSYRRRWKVCLTLLLHAHLDPTAHRTAVRFWTRCTERIALNKGWPLYFRVTDDQQEADA